MRLHTNLFALMLCVSITTLTPAQHSSKLALPSPEQVAWQEMELEMFIHLAPCTWQDRERDDGSTPMEKINPTKLDTDQWVRVAESMGAKQIVFVAKHVGGFCWWQTETSDHGVKRLPWRGGQGDVVADLAESCRRRGMKLGLYLSPADSHLGATVGGKCKTPEAQARYAKIFRQQLTELLSRYGQVHEVWFDGSCVIDVGDILAKYTPKAMVFQGPHATLRWVGNEDGIAPYPGWNSVSEKDGRSGVATGRHGNPDGPVWMPLECDARIRNKWFWSSKNAHTLKSLDQLMDMYYKSVGRGAVLLLNNTPDTSGLIPETDVKRTAEFGDEIRRRFGRSVGETSGDGVMVNLDLGRPMMVDHIVTMEEIRYGERVREYIVEGLVNGSWQPLTRGTAIGHKRIDRIESVIVSQVRLRIIRSVAEPRIRKLAVYNTAAKPLERFVSGTKDDFQLVDTLNVLPKNASATQEIDLSPFIREAGQFEVIFKTENTKENVTLKNAKLLLQEVDSPTFIESITVNGEKGFHLNITEFPTAQKGTIRIKVNIETLGTKTIPVKVLMRKCQVK